MRNEFRDRETELGKQTVGELLLITVIHKYKINRGSLGIIIYLSADL